MHIDIRRAAGAVAAMRVALGAVAVARPGLAARPWVGRTGTAAAVLSRAAGARDIALGAGLLLSSARGDAGAARVWTAAGAFCDTADALITAVHWRRLPAGSRAAVAAAAGGAAALGALVLATGPHDPDDVHLGRS